MFVRDLLETKEPVYKCIYTEQKSNNRSSRIFQFKGKSDNFRLLVYDFYLSDIRV